MFVWLLEIKDATFAAVALISFGVVSYLTAEYVTRKYLFYRHGVEEALAFIAMVIFCAGSGILLSENHLTLTQLRIVLPALLAITACWIYLRFGLLYAAAISIVALGFIPFQFNLSPATERIMLLSALCAIFVFSLIADQPDIEDFRKDKYTKMQAGLLTGDIFNRQSAGTRPCRIDYDEYSCCSSEPENVSSINLLVVLCSYLSDSGRRCLLGN